MANRLDLLLDEGEPASGEAAAFRTGSRPAGCR